MTWGAEDLADSIGATTNKDFEGNFAFTYKLARSLMENGREEEGAAIMRDIEKRHSQWNKAKREKL